jgi:hypothetical protein
MCRFAESVMAEILDERHCPTDPGTGAVNQFTLRTPLTAVALRVSKPLQVDNLHNVAGCGIMRHGPPRSPPCEDHVGRDARQRRTGRFGLCSDYRCSHSIAMAADGWSDDVRLSDIEPRFVCKACGKRGADVRPHFAPARKGTVRVPVLEHRGLTGCSLGGTPCSSRATRCKLPIAEAKFHSEKTCR